MELEYGVEELIISKGITLDEFISNLFLANRIIVFEDINDYVRLFSHKKESLIPKSDFYASDVEDGYQILRVYSSEKRYYIKKIVLNEQIIKIAITDNHNIPFMNILNRSLFIKRIPNSAMHPHVDNRHMHSFLQHLRIDTKGPV